MSISRNTSVLRRRVSRRKRRDSIFSLEKNISTARTPKRRTKKYTAMLPIVVPARQSSVPSTAPKA